MLHHKLYRTHYCGFYSLASWPSLTLKRQHQSFLSTSHPQKAALISVCSLSHGICVIECRHPALGSTAFSYAAPFSWNHTSELHTCYF